MGFCNSQSICGIHPVCPQQVLVDFAFELLQVLKVWVAREDFGRQFVPGRNNTGRKSIQHAVSAASWQTSCKLVDMRLGVLCQQPGRMVFRRPNRRCRRRSRADEVATPQPTWGLGLTGIAHAPREKKKNNNWNRWEQYWKWDKWRY